MPTVRLTVAQALVRFLAAQYTERDGTRQRFIEGCWGIFGHGNVAGVGQALLQAQQTGEADLKYYLARNEQAMVHASVGFARMRNRLATFACTASIGPGSTNMITGAALATINRIPVLLLPSDFFATRAASPVLQELEDPRSYDVSVNDAFKPVSRFWDRINRPEQLPSALLAAMRVLTDPAETGAVTLALPQDVQAEAHDWPADLFTERTWFVPRPLPEPAALGRAVEVLRNARRPLVVAGGGVIYSEAGPALRAFAEATGIGVSDTQAGKGALAWDHPCAVGGVGATGSPVANALAREADVILGIGTRYSDFTTASRTAFQNPDVRFVNLNVTAFDAGKHAGTSLVADARAGLEALTEALSIPGAGYHVDPEYDARVAELDSAWRPVVEHAYHLGHQPLPAQTEILGALNEFIDDRDVVVQAAGSMPGDLQMLWRARDPKQYHVEYGYSCMGYEIAGGLGAKMASPDREVFVLVGDGSYLMMATGDRDRGLRGDQAEHRPGAEPGLRLDRRAVRIARLAAVRHRLPLPRPGVGAAGRRRPPGRPGRQRGQPRRRRDQGPHGQGPAGRAGAVPGVGPDHGHLYRDRPARPGAVFGELVGRAGVTDLRAGQHAAGPCGLRGGQARSADLPLGEITDAYYPALDCRLGDDRRVDAIRAGVEPGHR